MTIASLFRRNLDIRKAHSREFRRCFGFDLGRCYCNLFGIDVLELESLVGPVPDDVSLHDHIAGEYGEEAAAVVNRILDREAAG